jgi:hypothetical protein
MHAFIHSSISFIPPDSKPLAFGEDKQTNKHTLDKAVTRIISTTSTPKGDLALASHLEKILTFKLPGVRNQKTLDLNRK